MYVMDTRRIRKRLQVADTAETISDILDINLAEKIKYGVTVNKKMLDSIITDVSATYHEIGIDLPYDQIKNAVTIYTIATGILDNSEFEEFVPEYIYDYLAEEGKIFHQGDIENNPYIANIHLNEKRVGNMCLSSIKYKKYEPIVYNTPSIRNGVLIPKIGCFDHRFTCPVIGEYEGEDFCIWMSVSPYEIFTMEEPVRAASGNVLVLGCGLGYFAYMAALKNDVSKVTIIEQSPEIIEMFKSEILPQFSVKNKIEIIEADAFDYMEQLDDGVFDFCFADLWYGDTDYIPYLKLKKICSKFKQMRMFYCDEDAIVAPLTGIVVGEMIDVCEGTNYMEEFVADASEDDIAIYNAIKEIIADVRITKPEQIDFFLDWKNIAQLLGRNKSDC